MRVTTANPYKKIAKPRIRTSLPKAKKLFFECIGGPYDGERLFLETGKTLPFTVNGQSGQYVQSAHSSTRIVWSPNVNH